MNLKMNYNSFIKLKDFFKIQDISAEIEEYEVNDVNIEGQLSIKGKYLRRDNISEEYFLEKIPFSILMPNSDFEIEDINCIDFEYVAVDGRGVDVTFDILINYLVYEEVPVVVETRDEMVLKTVDEKTAKIEAVELDEENFEELKKEETKRIDKLLNSTLNYKDDNLPTEEIIIRGLSEPKSIVKVCYYQNESDLEKVCNDNEISLDKIFKKNQRYEFTKYHRVILNDK